LHQQGASGLWLQLVADGGKTDNLHLALEQARGDLHGLAYQPLLCFDEVDHLVTTAEKITPEQQQLHTFLEILRGLAPILLIGQQHNLLADAYHTLEGLTLSQMEMLLQQSGIGHNVAEAARLHTYTTGNARMIWLCMALCQNGRSLTDVLDSLPKTAVFQALFTRFWQSLTSDEQQLLRQIAVFRSPAPDDAFPQAVSVMDSLTARHILQRDGQGAVLLIPLIHDLIYEDRQRLPAEEREQAHLRAANIRAERSEYTAAAYHFVQGGEMATAVQVWFPHRQKEIKRGQASAALAIFAQFSQRRLPDAEAQALALLRAELYQLTGETEQGLTELRTVNWQEDGETAVQAHLLQGTFLNALGYPQVALEKLEDGLAAIARLMEKMVRFRQQRTLIHIQQWQMPDAVREVRLAQYTAEHLQGLIQEQQGNYDDAYLAYHQALALARSIRDEAGMAQTNRSLATILWRQSRLDEARLHIQASLDYYDTIGDRLSWEKARNTLMLIHYQAREFNQVITIGETSLSFFERAKIPYFASVTASNLAESYYETGDLDKAEYYAHKTLAMEEAHTFPYALYTLGLVYRANKQYIKAEKILQQAQEAAADNSDSYMEAYALRLLAEVFADQGLREQAVQTARRALRQFEQLNIRVEIETTKTMLDTF
jgi:tetratricopeptide (TPR) repeat protein